MKSPIQRKLKAAGARLNLNLMLDMLGLCLLLAAVTALLAVLAERLLAFNAARPWMAGPLAGAAVAAAGALWLIRRPSRLAVAIEVDQRLGLRERFSTAVALADRDDPFAQAAVAEARQRADAVKIGQSFPLHIGRRWIGSLAAVALTVAAFFFMPTLDLLGNQAKRDELKKDQLALAVAKDDVEKAVQRVEAAVKQLPKNELAADLAALNQLTAAPTQQPQEVRRQAIKQLGELARKLSKQLEKNDVQASAAVNKMLRHLRGSPKGLDDKLNEALARGNFDKASQMLRDLDDKMRGGELSKEQTEALANQLDDLAKQLEQIAANEDGLEQALEDLGLDGGLANLDAEALKDALARQGLTQEQIQELLDQQQISEEAAQKLAQLAQAMKQCGAQCSQGGGDGQMASMGAEELAELLEQLEEMDGAAGEMAAIQATLDELENAQLALGECDGSCGGTCPSCMAAAQGNGQLAGMKGQPGGIATLTGIPSNQAGKGHLANERQEDDQANYTPTLSPGEQKQGPAVASWYFKGPQVKGEASESYKAAVQAAKDAAAESVSENVIPKRYEPAIKRYFGQLEESNDSTDGASTED